MRALLAATLVALAAGCQPDPGPAASDPATPGEPSPPATGAASSATAPTASPDIPPAGDSLDTDAEGR